jgi:glutathione S-transferase
MDWSQATLQSDFLMGVFWGFYRTPEAQWKPTCHRRQGQGLRAAFPIARSGARRPSVPLGRQSDLGGYSSGNLALPVFRDRDRAALGPNVEAWYQRLQERPAYREHIMVPFSELYGRLDY